MDTFNRVARILKIVIVVGAVLVGLKLATGTSRHDYRLPYGKFPADDQALVEWLKAQPDVSNVSVAREGGELSVSFSIPTRGGSAPDLVKETERLGYEAPGPVTSHIGLHLW